MRIINADLIKYESILESRGNGNYEEVMIARKNQIDELPYADVWPVTRCKCCMSAIPPNVDYNFCPMCGERLKVNDGGFENSVDQHKLIDYEEDKLAPYIEPADQKTYQRGLDDAWDAARKIALTESDGGMSTDDVKKMFGSFLTCKVLKNTTATEAVEKIREYEDRKAQEDAEIKVGDEVILDFFGQEMKVIALECDKGRRKILMSDGKVSGVFTVKNDTLLKRTGRHVDLSQLFGGVTNET